METHADWLFASSAKLKELGTRLSRLEETSRRKESEMIDRKLREFEERLDKLEPATY